MLLKMAHSSRDLESHMTASANTQSLLSIDPFTLLLPLLMPSPHCLEPPRFLNARCHLWPGAFSVHNLAHHVSILKYPMAHTLRLMLPLIPRSLRDCNPVPAHGGGILKWDISVGMCLALSEEPYVVTKYHGHYDFNILLPKQNSFD